MSKNIHQEEGLQSNVKVKDGWQQNWWIAEYGVVHETMCLPETNRTFSINAFKGHSTPEIKMLLSNLISTDLVLSGVRHYSPGFIQPISVNKSLKSNLNKEFMLWLITKWQIHSYIKKLEV